MYAANATSDIDAPQPVPAVASCVTYQWSRDLLWIVHVLSLQSFHTLIVCFVPVLLVLPFVGSSPSYGGADGRPRCRALQVLCRLLRAVS